MKAILVAVDFSEVTGAVIEQSILLAQTFSARIRLVHVAPPDPDFVGYEFDPPALRDQVAAKYRDLHRKIQDLGNEMWDRKIDVKSLLIQGPTVEAILGEAQHTHSDLIIMGSHGRGGISRMVLGSVSEGVVRGAKCPVLIIPAKEAKC